MFFIGVHESAGAFSRTFSITQLRYFGALNSSLICLIEIFSNVHVRFLHLAFLSQVTRSLASNGWLCKGHMHFCHSTNRKECCRYRINRGVDSDTTQESVNNYELCICVLSMHTYTQILHDQLPVSVLLQSGLVRP